VAEDEDTSGAGGAGDAVEVGEEDAGAELGDGLTVAAGLGVGLELLVGGAGVRVFEDGEGEGSVEGSAGSADVEVDEIAVDGPVAAADKTIGTGVEVGVGGIEDGDEDENGDGVGVGVGIEVETAGGGSDGTVDGNAVGDDEVRSAGTFEAAEDGMATGELTR
jgi:hypothetical protein